MKVLKDLVLLGILMVIPFLIVAQPDEESEESPKYIANQHARQLKDGVLVVQLKTYRNKINALKNMKPTERNKKYLKELIEERRKLGLATMAAYNTFYTFSKVYFIPDTLTSRLMNGEQSGIFLNDSLGIDNDIDLNKSRFYLAYVGMPPMSRSSGKISLLIVDNENNLLPSPFPYATRFYGFFQTLAGTSEADAMPKAVKLLEKRLWKFLIE